MSTPPEKPATARRSSARDRLLETASQVFYAEGINGVSVDRVIEAADGTRSTFYRYFPSKDHLVAAYLTDRDEQIRNACAAAAEHEPDPAELLKLVLHAIGDMLCGPGFRGCPFINAAAEFPDPQSIVHQAVTTHRSWFRSLIHELVDRAGLPQPDRAAQTLIMLRDGAMVGGYLEDADTTRSTLIDATDAIIATRTPEQAP